MSTLPDGALLPCLALILFFTVLALQDYRNGR